MAQGTDVSLPRQLASFVNMFDKYFCVKNLLLQGLFKQCGYFLFVPSLKLHCSRPFFKTWILQGEWALSQEDHDEVRQHLFKRKVQNHRFRCISLNMHHQLLKGDKCETLELQIAVWLKTYTKDRSIMQSELIPLFCIFAAVTCWLIIFTQSAHYFINCCSSEFHFISSN